MSVSNLVSHLTNMTNGERTTTFWRSRPFLGSNEVHLWLAHLDLTPSAVERLATVLSDDERARAKKYRFRQGRNRFIVARGFLRETLARYLDTGPARLCFRYGPHGKPSLALEGGEPDIRFNLSHAHGCAICAVTLGLEVGIDLEVGRSEETAKEIADRLFTASERSFLNALPEPERAGAFLKLWTIKEAFLKATGDGLTGDIEGLEVRWKDGNAELLQSKGDKLKTIRNWHFKVLKPWPRYIAALAVPGRGCRISTFRWPEGSELKALQFVDGTTRLA